MAQIKNLTAGSITITASRGDLGGEDPFNLTIAASATETVPDNVAKLAEVQALVTGGSFEMVSWDATDSGDVSQDELKALMIAGSDTLANASLTVVADTNVQAASVIFLMFRDAAGSALTHYIDPANHVAGTSFQIDHAAAAGTEVFDYLILDPSFIA